MKILVTGGSGFIGTHLVQMLVREGHEVRIFDRHTSRRFEELVTLGDVCDEGSLSDAARDADVVYHLAAEHRDDVRPASRYYDVNVGGTSNIATVCERHGIDNIVFVSSIAVYGRRSAEPDEETAPNPSSDYGKSKLEAEEVLRDFADRGSRRSLWIVRPAVVFGKGHTGNVQTLIRQIQAGRFVMVGDGTNRKSMCYVGNLVHFLAQYGIRSESGVRLANFADKPDLTMNELVMFIRQELGLEDELLIRVPYWLGILGGYLFDGLAAIGFGKIPFSAERVRKFSADTRVACSTVDAMGFSSPYSIREGLRLTIAHTDSDTAGIGDITAERARSHHPL